MFRILLLLASSTRIPSLVLRLLMDSRVPLRLKLLLAAPALYLVLPIDLVPDALGALGRIDDLLAILIGTSIFVSMAPREVVREHLKGGSGRGTTSPPKDARPGDSTIIDGSFRYVDHNESPQD